MPAQYFISILFGLCACLAVTATARSDETLERDALPATSGIRVQFASDDADDAFNLVLAQTQVLVRIAQDLHLRCELSSYEEHNADPEIRFDLGVHFRFR